MTRPMWELTVLLVAMMVSPVVLRGEDMPTVPDGFRISLVAKEPLVRNPCAMVFDAHGRMCIGMGPQYRSPRPETPGDSVYILTDSDNDGVYDKRHVFATGFNSIQGMAWHGRDLWIANSPDLTVVRDLDGDDVADRYTRLYTDLGNLEHGLHGLHWGPDGRMYMSKGNSKGLTRPGRLAPLPFRELWGVRSPKNSPSFPAPRVSGPMDYEKNYHDPADDWGREGGVLVCDDGGKNLEIVSRGFRNPWDIAYDSGFNFQGTDNDQNEGDRVFNPFFGSHYGWGHPWSSHWSGEAHLPTSRITGPVFHGSGTGITFYDDPHFPEPFRKVWFFNDWLRRTTYFYRPGWRGALIEPEGGQWREFVRGGKSLFKPTDVEVGPDGCLYILGWGNAYGAMLDKQGRQTNEGRVFRVTWGDRGRDVQPMLSDLARLAPETLINGLGSSIEARRVDCQEELIRRGSAVVARLARTVDREKVAERVRTWAAWALGRIGLSDRSIDGRVVEWVRPGRPTTLRVQALRILSHRVRLTGNNRPLPEAVSRALADSEARVRMAAVLAVRRSRDLGKLPNLLQRMKVERDRIVFYAGWQAMRQLMTKAALRKTLAQRDGGVRLAALLALAEDHAVDAVAVKPLLKDGDARVRGVAALWMARGAGSPLVRVNPAGGEFRDRVNVTVEAGVKPGVVYYSVDGTVPTMRSPRWGGARVFSRSLVLKLAVFVGEQRVGPVGEYRFTRISISEAASRSGVIAARARSGRAYQIVDGGLQKGRLVYTDRSYAFKDIPSGFAGSLIVQTANEDASSSGDQFLNIDTVIPVTLFLGHDTRVSRPPSWMLGKKKQQFRRTNIMVSTSDATFRLFERKCPAGRIVIGGNTDDGLDGNKSNFLGIIRPAGLPRLEKQTTVKSVLPLLSRGKAERGKALFFSTGGAGCAKCHRTDTKQPPGFGPDLASLLKQADPRKVVTSILDPSVEIKEGFTMLLIVTDEGKTLTGILASETGATLSLLQPNGRTVVVPKGSVDERISQKVSPMPSFERLLTPGQVADVTAYLMSLRSERSPGGR